VDNPVRGSLETGEHRATDPEKLDLLVAYEIAVRPKIVLPESPVAGSLLFSFHVRGLLTDSEANEARAETSASYTFSNAEQTVAKFQVD
jgi:hypothetical protein